jgi:hypothetical protein
MARGVQTDMGGGFGREIDDRIEGLANDWLDLQAELKELKERKDAAGELVLARMQAVGVPYYVCSDGTPLSIETTIKVTGKRKKRKAIDDAREAVRESLDKLTEDGATVTIKAGGKPEVVIGRGRGRKPGKGEAN